jgi:hypothetical protein
MAGNLVFGEDGHLNKGGSDTDAHPNGMTNTIPNVAEAK